MIELPVLYDHQSNQISKLKMAMRYNNANILCANPGVGKTRMSKWIFASALLREQQERTSGRLLFTVHRRGLVDNACQSFAEGPSLPFGVVMSDRETNWGHRLQVASIDTLVSWHLEGDDYITDATFDLVVFDECHSHHSKLVRWWTAHNKKREELGLKPAFLIGLSATPEATGLADIYGSIVKGETTEWLIANKFLSPFRYVAKTKGRTNLLVKSGDSYTDDSLKAAFDGLAGDFVRDWLKFAEGRATVGFFPRLSHAQEALALLQQAGVPAAYVDGYTEDEDRNKMFRALECGDIKYICNVGIVERGTNIPAIECVQLCTSIGSVVRYRQMIGRGSRTKEGKDCCFVIDHGDNIKRFGFFEDEIDWTLDRSVVASKEHAPNSTMKCPRCGVIYRGGLCKACGYEPSVTERKAQGLVFDGHELTEIKREERKKEPMTPEKIMIIALYKAARSGRTWSQALAMAFAMAKKHNVYFTVPKNLQVGKAVIEMLPAKSEDSMRRVCDLFDGRFR